MQADEVFKDRYCSVSAYAAKGIAAYEVRLLALNVFVLILRGRYLSTRHPGPASPVEANHPQFIYIISQAFFYRPISFKNFHKCTIKRSVYVVFFAFRSPPILVV